MRILPLLLPVALLLPATTATAQKINDVVLKKDGARVRGVEITDFLLSGVRGKRGSDDFELPAHLVKDIEWSDLPEEFLAGKGAMGRGDFAAAAQFFGAVQSDRPLVKTDAEFFKVKAAIADIMCAWRLALDMRELVGAMSTNVDRTYKPGYGL